jgi:hypothetical protein
MTQTTLDELQEVITEKTTSRQVSCIYSGPTGPSSQWPGASPVRSLEWSSFEASSFTLSSQMSTTSTPRSGVAAFTSLDRGKGIPALQYTTPQGSGVGMIGLLSDSSIDSLNGTAATLASETQQVHGVLLSWEDEVACLEIAVDRADERARRAAYAMEIRIAEALPGLPLSFVLIDVSDIPYAVAAGVQTIYRRRPMSS